MHPNLHKLKEEICDIGRRLYAKGFAAGNDGNISYRLSENEVLCSPTFISKGFMKPDDLCIVDMQGVVHCHPPHATAFAVAREPIPQCILPEVEVFLGDVPITKYETPGGQAFADTVLPFVKKASVIILANHGTVSYGDTVEHAYWWTEVLDAYCRILLMARDLGRVNYFDERKTRELLEFKTRLGFKDARLDPDMENCDICANDVFRDSWKRTGVDRKAFEPPRPMGKAKSTDADQETLIQAITDRVVAALNAR